MAHLKLGKYEHFKGNKYEVIGVARHSETQEEFVVYRSISQEDELWIRPISMFLEEVEFEGSRVPRFRYIGG